MLKQQNNSNFVAPSSWPRGRSPNRGRGRGRGRVRGQGSAPGMYRGCPNCQSTGQSYSCKHCFKCGSPDHYKSDCPSFQQQRNGNRLCQGQGVTGSSNKKSSLCTGCGKLLKETVVLQCKGCKAAKYCDQKCQKGHWLEHKVLCSAIQRLSCPNSAKISTIDSNSGHFKTHLTFKQHAKVVGLVGKCCMVNCQFNGTS